MRRREYIALARVLFLVQLLFMLMSVAILTWVHYHKSGAASAITTLIVVVAACFTTFNATRLLNKQ